MEKTFDEVITPILAAGVDLFCTVVYPPPRRWKNEWDCAQFRLRAFRGGEARKELDAWRKKREKRARNWLGEIFLRTGNRSFRSIVVTEECRDLSYRYHVLMGGICLEKLQKLDWKKRWKEMSGGYGYERQVHERTGGLLGYFVMRLGCPMEVFVGESPENYSRDDFLPWKPRSD
jgi:hypothetical protein